VGELKKIHSMARENASDSGLNTLEEMHHSLREILDGIVLRFLIFFTVARIRESHGLLCSAESLVNQLDLQNH
jgi:hypothetical protein